MRTLVWLVGLAAQEPSADKLAPIPEIRAHALPDGSVVAFAARMEKAHYEFLRTLRRVPAAESRGEPTSLVIPRYLKRPARAFDTPEAYVESDWIKPEDLAVAAAVACRAGEAMRALVGGDRVAKVSLVYVRKRDDYYALVDAWSDNDRIRREARFLGSTLVGDYRCGYEDEDLGRLLAVAAGDAVMKHTPGGLWHQEPLREGLHAYLSGFLTARFVTYVDLGVTTAEQRKNGQVPALMRAAREYLARPKRDDLATILRSELNQVTFEKLAVMFALVDYLLRTKRDCWKEFAAVLQKESYEGRKVKGPEGRAEALKVALKSAMDLDLGELDGTLQTFASKEYLFEEDLARLTGVHRECAESAFQGFVTVCQLRRQGKPTSGKGDTIHSQIMGRVEKKLEAGRLPF